MSRYLLLVAVGLVGVASADPVPEPKGAERLKWLYGDPTELPTGYSVELSADDRLQMRLPKSTGSGFDIPVVRLRTTRLVDGDFVATVRVSDQTTAGPPAENRNRAVAAGGLIVGEGTWIGVQLSAGRNPGHPERKRSATYFIGKKGGGTSYIEDDSQDPCWLRLTRNRGAWSFERSPDGFDWTPLTPPVTEPAAVPARTTIGLFAVNGGNAPYFVEFDKFTVKPPAAARK